jgi:hypothetical protein
MGSAVVKLVEHYERSQNVVGTIPDDATRCVSCPNPFSRTMARGLTQPPTKIRTRNLPVSKARPVPKAENLTAICE